MAFSTAGGGPSNPQINVTPLIDVLLVMLIIFMVIVPVMPRGLNSAIPSATSGTAEAGDRPILVQVEQGQIGRRRELAGPVPACLVKQRLCFRRIVSEQPWREAKKTTAVLLYLTFLSR